MKRKIIVIIMFILLLALLAVEAILMINQNNRYLMGEIKQLSKTADLTLQFAAESLHNQTGEADWILLASKASSITGYETTFTNEFGELLGSSAPTNKRLYSLEYETDVIRARSGGTASSISEDLDTNIKTIYLTKSPVLLGKQLVMIRLSSPLSDFAYLKTNMLMIVILFLLIVCSLFIISVYLFPKMLRFISRDSLAAGENTTEPNPSDIRLRKLTEKIENLNDSFNKKNSYINVMLANMDYGLIVVDTNNNATLINPKAEELTGIEISIFFLDQAIDYEISQNIKLIFSWTAEAVFTEAEKTYLLKTDKEQTLEIHVMPMYNKYYPYELFGAQAAIKDITKAQELEALRRDFVANVSHELRTPLTSIIGFIETVKTQKNLPATEKTRALEIIELESMRLLDLVAELLTLSKIENSLGREEYKIIPTTIVAREARQVLAAQASEKDIQLVWEVEDDLPTIVGHGEWLRIIITNLCDNSIKYTQRGGRIKLKITSDKSNLILCVEDNGIGILQQDIPYIFQRFYRVNKGRGRKEGGNGLGLAIVKHIVEELDGEISVSSIKNEGSKFVVTIPSYNKKYEQIEGGQ